MHAAASETHMCRLTWARMLLVGSARGLFAVRRGPSRASPRRSKMKGMRSSDEELQERGGGGRYLLLATPRSLGISIDICRAAVDLSRTDGLIYNPATSNQQTPRCHPGHPPTPPRPVDSTLPLRHVIFY